MAVMSRVRRVAASPSFFAYVDQGQVSVGNLLTQLLLARRLAPDDYGTFILLFGAMLIGRSLHAAVVTYPLSVWGATATDDEARRHASESLMATLWWSVPAGGIIAILGVAVGRPELIPLGALALAVSMLQETCRRVLFARLRFRSALGGDAVSYLGQAVALGVVLRSTTSLQAVLLTMAVTSGLAFVVQLVQVRPIRPTTGQVWLRDGMRFGGWMLATNIVQPLTLQLAPWLLAGIDGKAATASYQAIATLLGVSNPVMAASSNLVVPIAARAATEGLDRVRHLVIRVGLWNLALLAPVFGVMLLVPTKILELAYGERSAYASLGPEMRLLTLTYLVILVLNVLGNFFVGVGRSKVTFAAQVAGAVVSLALGPVLIATIGVAGACLTLGVSSAVQVVWLGRVYRSDDVAPPAPASGAYDVDPMHS